MKNPVAKAVRTPKFKPKKIEFKKKYNRKKKIAGYYMDYDGKERIIYEDER